jgi:N-terminal acetyltransferase B complex catalytic subunit
MCCVLCCGGDRYRAYFVDLYVRVSNSVAVGMYKKFGYIPYRQVIGYYSGEEDAYGRCFRRLAARCAGAECVGWMCGTDMRKALSRDPDKKSMIPLPHPVHPSEND